MMMTITITILLFLIGQCLPLTPRLIISKILGIVQAVLLHSKNY